MPIDRIYIPRMVATAHSIQSASLYALLMSVWLAAVALLVNSGMKGRYADFVFFGLVVLMLAMGITSEPFRSLYLRLRRLMPIIQVALGALIGATALAVATVAGEFRLTGLIALAVAWLLFAVATLYLGAFYRFKTSNTAEHVWSSFHRRGKLRLQNAGSVVLLGLAGITLPLLPLVLYNQICLRICSGPCPKCSCA